MVHRIERRCAEVVIYSSIFGTWISRAKSTGSPFLQCTDHFKTFPHSHSHNCEWFGLISSFLGNLSCRFALCPPPICLRHDQQSEMSVLSDDENLFIELCGRGCLFQFQSSKLKLKVSEGFPISRWIIPQIGHLLTRALPAQLIMVRMRVKNFSIGNHCQN